MERSKYNWIVVRSCCVNFRQSMHGRILEHPIEQFVLESYWMCCGCGRTRKGIAVFQVKEGWIPKEYCNRLPDLPDEVFDTEPKELVKGE